MKDRKIILASAAALIALLIVGGFLAFKKTEKEENLIKIIKTTYTRNNERLKKGKQVGEKDETYFNKAEKLLYSELAISLGMNYDEVKQYIFDTIHEVTS